MSFEILSSVLCWFIFLCSRSFDLRGIICCVAHFYCCAHCIFRETTNVKRENDLLSHVYRLMFHDLALVEEIRIFFHRSRMVIIKSKTLNQKEILLQSHHQLNAGTICKHDLSLLFVPVKVFHRRLNTKCFLTIPAVEALHEFRRYNL